MTGGKIILITGLLLIFFELPAQQFKVRSFHVLQNDITAWMNPVRDLNKEACALIKIVGGQDFEFSTPLGIVLRKNKTGECWLYIPNGSIQITLKHARWGVMRDYRFPEPLEARLTYEMVIEPPVLPEEKEKPLQVNRISSLPKNRSLDFGLTPTEKRKLSRHRVNGMIALNIGMHQQEPSYGLFLGLMKKAGAYLHVQSNFRFLTTDGECDKTGFLPDGQQAPYYTGHTRQRHDMITAGGIQRIAGLVYLYEGIGYGNHILSWETLEGKQLKNTHYSVRGITGEIGGLVKFRRWVASIGVITIQGKYWEPIVGIGIHF